MDIQRGVYCQGLAHAILEVKTHPLPSASRRPPRATRATGATRISSSPHLRADTRSRDVCGQGTMDVPVQTQRGNPPYSAFFSYSHRQRLGGCPPPPTLVRATFFTASTDSNLISSWNTLTDTWIPHLTSYPLAPLSRPIKLTSTGVLCSRVKSPVRIMPLGSNVSFRVDISLLTFCLDDRSTAVSGVRGAPTFLVFLSVAPFSSIGSCYMCFDAPQVGAYMLMCMSSWPIVPFVCKKHLSLFIVAFSGHTCFSLDALCSEN